MTIEEEDETCSWDCSCSSLTKLPNADEDDDDGNGGSVVKTSDIVVAGIV